MLCHFLPMVNGLSTRGSTVQWKELGLVSVAWTGTLWSRRLAPSGLRQGCEVSWTLGEEQPKAGWEWAGLRLALHPDSSKCLGAFKKGVVVRVAMGSELQVGQGEPSCPGPGLVASYLLPGLPSGAARHFWGSCQQRLWQLAVPALRRRPGLWLGSPKDIGPTCSSDHPFLVQP